MLNVAAGIEKIALGIYYEIRVTFGAMKGCESPLVSRVCDDLETEKKITIFERQQAVRTERYALQSVAKELLPNERVTICLRNMLGDFVEVQRHQKTNKAFYNGLMICGSIWTCPVCAAKVSEKRKNEMVKATTLHKAAGGYLAMLTLTVRHKRSDDLGKLLEAFNNAVRVFMSGKAYHRIRQDMNIIGRVKALEVTHGVNGWHPHAHIVVFYENMTDLEAIKNRMYHLWDAACKKFGLSTTKSYGIDLQGADYVQAYLTKHGSWSIEQEMTKSHIKKGRGESLTPFDLLRDVLYNDDDYSKVLFVDYAKYFKGKRQLHWSPGLKDMFNINEKTDEELAKEKIEQADLFGLLTFQQWKEIIRKDLRAQLLTNIEKFGFDIGLEVTGIFAQKKPI